jgi:hypothetical protein
MFKPDVTIVSREHCHLCEAAMDLARRLQPELRFNLTYADVADDPALGRRYGLLVPVVLVDGAEACWGQVSEEALRSAVKKARWRRPISRILSRLGSRRWR